ncbi:MAG: hypothetical protein NC218_03320 [Acetobacter sp.]|nr:hypothetical protein [Acetobacter sp.]
MGQYYNIATSDTRNGKIICHSVQVKNNDYTGIKLLEHSYYNNYTMNAVCAFLFKNPQYIAWVGDYSNDDTRAPEALRKRLHKACWCEGAEEESWDKVESNKEWKFLVNHTKCTYIDLNKHFEMSHEDDTWSSGDYICIHPLSLLVAIGNGMGGGDYHEEYVNYHYTGSWAWDKISIEAEAPEHFSETICPFTETRDDSKKAELNNLTHTNLAMEESQADCVHIQGADYARSYIDASWGETKFYMLVQKDAGGDIELAVDAGENGRKNLEYMRDNEYDKAYGYAIVEVSASDYFSVGVGLCYDLLDLATDAIRNREY